MTALKEKLIGTLGIAGYILYYILICFITFLPLWVLDYPFGINLILVAVILYVPYIGDITQTIIYVLSFIEEIGRIKNGDADVVTLLYFIAMIIHVFLFLMPFLVLLFSLIRGLIVSAYESIKH